MQNFFYREQNESDEIYNARYESFILSIKKNYTYAGDFEISTACILLNTKILIYNFNISGYKLLNAYSPNNQNKNGIYIVYRNNNHFNLLTQRIKNGEEMLNIS